MIEPAPDAVMAVFLSGFQARTFARVNVRRELQREKLHCTWCGQKVPKGKRNWCSKPCVDAWKIRSDPELQRRKVQVRDAGVCAGCGLDTERISRVMRKLARAAQQPTYVYQVMGHHTNAEWPGWARRRARYKEAKALLGQWLGKPISDSLFAAAPHLWEMDHVIPVSEGGGGCGLENLRTLCRPCHKRATAALAARAAAKRAFLEKTKRS